MRLTERIINEKGEEHIFTKYIKDNQKLKDKKLCDLEDIEEELGIDLITLFKALKNGIYRIGINVYGDYDDNFDKVWYGECELDIEDKTLYEISDISFEPVYPVKLKDYGVTWSLKKEDLENENRT